MFAARNGHADCVERLLRADGINVNAVAVQGLTALMFAAQNGHTDCVERLLSAPGINVNAVNAQGGTALMFAAANGHADCIQPLISNGANIDMRDNFHSTALVIARHFDHQRVVNLLVDEGYEV